MGRKAPIFLNPERSETRLEPYRQKLFACGFLIACVTEFSRIIMGAHYLTDVTAGFFCGFTILLLVWRRFL